MRYPLCNRFRATLIGAVIGQTVVLPSNSQDREDSELSEWGRLAVLGTQSLIRLGRFDLDDWRNAFGEMIDCVSTKAIISTLPLALVYHENEIKLRQNLQLVAAGWQDNPVNRDSALAVGYAIAQALTEKLNVADLIPQTIAFLGPQTELAQQLIQVQLLLEQRAGLERVQSLLGRQAHPTTPIALAFYYFLSTLEDLRLSVMRAAQNVYQPQLTTAITGALSGAYNSTSGIPTSLRMKLTGADAKPLTAWGIKNEAEMLKLADSLFAVWSGVYDQTHSIELTRVAAIAAPRVIRSR